MSNYVKILCCLCGKSIESNVTARCAECLKAEVDITDPIQTANLKVYQCKRCEKWQGKSNHFVPCDLESVELLALLLKKIPGLDKQNLSDASFIWTEPHSKRLKVKVTLKREVLSKITIQQEKMAEFVIENRQCSDCARIYANQPWKALVQLRQRVSHKRTIHQLEQKILSQNSLVQFIDLKAQKDGLDFYFDEKCIAYRFVEWLKGVIPFKHQQSKKLIGADNHSNIAKDQLTIRCDIVPICKGDLVALPSNGGKGMGGELCGRVALVQSITSLIRLVDPMNGKKADITADKYWRHPLAPIASSASLVEFVVLDIEPVDPINFSQDRNEFLIADAEVARKQDLGENDDRFFVRTHLGKYLKAGSEVLGYDLRSGNCNDSALEGLRGEPPDIILVEKIKTKVFKKKNKKSSKNKKNATENYSIDKSEKEWVGDVDSSKESESEGKG